MNFWKQVPRIYWGRMGGQTAVNRVIVFYDEEGVRVLGYRCPSEDCAHEWVPQEVRLPVPKLASR